MSVVSNFILISPVFENAERIAEYRNTFSGDVMNHETAVGRLLLEAETELRKLRAQLAKAVEVASVGEQAIRSLIYYIEDARSFGPSGDATYLAWRKHKATPALARLSALAEESGVE